MMRLVGVLAIVLGAAFSLGWFFMSPPAFQSTEVTPRQKPERSGTFAADREENKTFDALRAMGYLEAICKIGARISGTDGMTKQQEMLQKHFEMLDGKVQMQRFTARQKSRSEPTEMANMIASWFPERRKRIILCSHYDTRPIADQEPDRRKWHEVFVSANDGGSGVALLMEMAHHIKDIKTGVGIDMVFFDGEEYIFNPAPEGDLYFFGSEYFGKNYKQGRHTYRYIAAVLLDMVGGKDPHFPVERNSWFSAAALVQDIWQTAADQRCPAFVNEFGVEIRDDHLALNRAGIPAVDIIDFGTYAHWHRLSDVPNNCSGESLLQVARVLNGWMQKLK